MAAPVAAPAGGRTFETRWLVWGWTFCFGNLNIMSSPGPIDTRRRDTTLRYFEFKRL